MESPPGAPQPKQPDLHCIPWIEAGRSISAISAISAITAITDLLGRDEGTYLVVNYPRIVVVG